MRVHDVRETVDALKVWRAIESAAGEAARSRRAVGPTQLASRYRQSNRMARSCRRNPTFSSWNSHATKYFGTDGIRGRVGEAPITPDLVMKLGWAAGRTLVVGRKARGAATVPAC